MAETIESTRVASPRPEPWQPSFNPWLIAVVVAMAAFMEVLDTSIANVALPYIAGGLAASNSQSTWVLTSYLAANAIVLPISGWLASRFGRKRFFILCILLFTGSSVLCGSAPSLGVLILFRAVQGAGGGGLQPMAQAILADTFPPQKRGMAFALYGITAVLAPTIGPTLGGWITYSYSWRWIFYINLPVGLLATFLVLRMVEDPPYLRERRNAGVRLDYIGLAFLAIGIGALQVVLDKGQEDDWFGSRMILSLSVTAAICLISLVVWEWLHRDPIMDLRLFKNFNFAAANLMMFTLGVVYFSSLVLMPQLLQTLMGYTSELAGLVLSASGAVLLVAMPFVGQLSGRVPAKYLIAFGWLLIGGAMFYSTKRIDLDISFNVAMWLRVAQTVGLPLLFVPINLASYIGIRPEKSNDVSGMINFMRNIGSSVGTSMVTTILARRAQFHQSTLVYHATQYDPAFQSQLNGLARQLVHSGTSVADAQTQARGLIYQLLGGQSQTLSYLDAFMVLAAGAGIMFLLSFLIRRNDPRAGGEVAVG
ncbi:MAG TPA: DHA2 family efflux MFS transporter permease subunit [Bryobacteraceae bacterium]|nr:DHA2 family efflux MFS transporter permease subunit [Bryobacteraceae bacterium]